MAKLGGKRRDHGMIELSNRGLMIELSEAFVVEKWRLSCSAEENRMYLGHAHMRQTVCMQSHSNR